MEEPALDALRTPRLTNRYRHRVPPQVQILGDDQAAGLDGDQLVVREAENLAK